MSEEYLDYLVTFGVPCERCGVLLDADCEGPTLCAQCQRDDEVIESRPLMGSGILPSNDTMSTESDYVT